MDKELAQAQQILQSIEVLLPGFQKTLQKRDSADESMDTTTSSPPVKRPKLQAMILTDYNYKLGPTYIETYTWLDTLSVICGTYMYMYMYMGTPMTAGHWERWVTSGARATEATGEFYAYNMC